MGYRPPSDEDVMICHLDHIEDLLREILELLREVFGKAVKKDEETSA